MTATLTKPAAHTATERQLITFYVGEMLVGLDITAVKEINRNLDVSTVPHAHRNLRGVINLRGEVVTVLDLRGVLELPAGAIGRHSRNVIVRWRSEHVGLLVDRISDVVNVPVAEIEPPPANLQGIDGKYINGVFTMPDQLLVLLNLPEVLESCTRTAAVS